MRFVYVRASACEMPFAGRKRATAGACRRLNL
jgi:hypothetical protein